MLLRPICVVLWLPGIRVGVLFNMIGRVVLLVVIMYICKDDAFKGQLILAQRSLSLVPVSLKRRLRNRSGKNSAQCENESIKRKFRRMENNRCFPCV